MKASRDLIAMMAATIASVGGAREIEVGPTPTSSFNTAYRSVALAVEILYAIERLDK